MLHKLLILVYWNAKDLENTSQPEDTEIKLHLHLFNLLMIVFIIFKVNVVA